MQLHIAGPWDAPAIAALEALCLPSDPWSREVLADYATNPDCAFLYATLDGAIVGYVVGRVLAPEAELYRIATHPDYRRAGIAQALLGAFVGKCRSRGASDLFLEVRASNVPAISLYTSFGFSEVGVRRGYYVNPKEDAVVMKLGEGGAAC